MRTAFIKTLEKLAEKNKDIYLLVGDVGFSVIEDFKKKYGKRFIDVGIAEQNMIGVAAGMALSKKIPFIYSIIPFATMRCFEQIRNDVCYQNLDVKIVGVGSGFAYGSAGSTHHAIEDIAIMKVLPNMTIICPGDPLESQKAIEQSVSQKGPVYIRLAKGGEKIIHNEKSIVNFKIGKGIVINEGNDLTIIATGSMLNTANNISQKLKKEGINATTISMHTIKPLDQDLIIKYAKKTKRIFTIEEHNMIGGLGESVARVLCENKLNATFKIFGIPDKYPDKIGNADYLRELAGLDEDTITKKIKEMIRNG